MPPESFDLTSSVYRFSADDQDTWLSPIHLVGMLLSAPFHAFLTYSSTSANNSAGFSIACESSVRHKYNTVLACVQRSDLQRCVGCSVRDYRWLLPSSWGWGTVLLGTMNIHKACQCEELFGRFDSASGVMWKVSVCPTIR
jgi:hypothetical protein